MTLALAFVVAVLFGVGAYLMLQRMLTRVIFGLAVMGHGANLLLQLAGGRAGTPPIVDEESGTAIVGQSGGPGFVDPLPQALALTAIVISFGVTAYLLAMAYRSWVLNDSDEVEDDVEDRRIARVVDSMAPSHPSAAVRRALDGLAREIRELHRARHLADVEIDAIAGLGRRLIRHGPRRGREARHAEECDVVPGVQVHDRRVAGAVVRDEDARVRLAGDDVRVRRHELRPDDPARAADPEPAGGSFDPHHAPLRRGGGRAASRLRDGQHTVVATGTASGKSLCYQLPLLQTVIDDDKATALYLSPTKALSRDQVRALRAFKLPHVRAAAYDGDLPRGEREAIRRTANVILTNPDMLHVGILPNHRRWGDVLARLSLVIVHQCHAARGRFGAPGDFAQAYVIAHEIGHHVQNQLGIMEKTQALRQRLSEAQSNALSVRVELQADCFAGV